MPEETEGQADAYTTSAVPQGKGFPDDVYVEERDTGGRFMPGNKTSVAGGKARQQTRRKPGAEGTEGQEFGFRVPSGVDRDHARTALLAVLADKKSSAAARVSAARSLAELEERAQTKPLPTSVAQIQAMSTSDLHELVRRLEGKGHPLPADLLGDTVTSS